MQSLTVEQLINAIPHSWHRLLAPTFTAPYWQDLVDFLNEEAGTGKIIYPSQENWFKALELVPPESVKVVILGQDPYHGPDQAHGLSFSVQRGVMTPPSLINIYKEIQRDLGLKIPRHGNLAYWAEQGVLLLNAVLTVEHKKAAAHRNRGWEKLTDTIIQQLGQHYQHIVFMLWGSFAQEKVKLIPQAQHCILQSAHPSPLSAHRGFLGNGHFSAANRYLRAHGRDEIDWQIP